MERTYNALFSFLKLIYMNVKFLFETMKYNNMWLKQLEGSGSRRSILSNNQQKI